MMLTVGLVLAVTVAETLSPSVGKVTVECDNARGWTFALESAAADGCECLTVRAKAAAESQPPPFEVKFSAPGTDVRHVWNTDFHRDFTLWPSLWNSGRSYESQLASEMPLLAALDANDRAKLVMSATEVMDKVRMTMVVNERTCRLECGMRFFTEPAAPRSSYSVKLRLDSRTRYWGDAVRNAADWIVKANGLEIADVPESAYDPLYSTWYAYLQDVNAAPLEKEAELAASLGMKTMILDDGWQKVESASFYSATGDWQPVGSRFPDMKAHVDAVHRAGLKYMLWLSVPYVGDESKAWPRFKDRMLAVRGQKSPGRVGVLDPRFPEVREYLIGTYERILRDWGFDGLKLDFIDSMVLPGTDPAVAQDYAGRDYKSLPLAVDRLMKDVLARLKKIRPDVLVEFRQHYHGPAIRQYGNMIRAADCPADMVSNRRRICDLRLTSGRTAVHSDMLVWSPEEAPETAALPILSALFSTIQYSMVLQTIPAAQREVIRHWLGFSQAHRATLLKGAFRPHYPGLGYPLVEAEGAAERIVVAYGPLVVPTGVADRTVYVVNATGEGELAVDVSAAATVEFFDTIGRKAGDRTVRAGLQRMSVPKSGYAKLTFGK